MWQNFALCERKKIGAMTHVQNGFFGKITQSHHILKHFFLKLVALVKDHLVDDCQSTYLTKQKTKETKNKTKPNLNSTHMPFIQCLCNKHLIQFTCKATKIFVGLDSLVIFSQKMFFFFQIYTLKKSIYFQKNCHQNATFCPKKYILATHMCTILNLHTIHGTH
jgi:hypothetical protein